MFAISPPLWYHVHNGRVNALPCMGKTYKTVLTMKARIELVKSLVACVAITLASAAWADKEVKDGVEWTFTIVGGEAKIGTGGKAAAIPTDTAGEIYVPDTLGGCPVKTIGSWAFYGCNRLTKVNLPWGLTARRA